MRDHILLHAHVKLRIDHQEHFEVLYMKIIGCIACKYLCHYQELHINVIQLTKAIKRVGEKLRILQVTREGIITRASLCSH